MRDAGGFPIEFVTIAVSDGISMGHEGMRGSLVSREIIADSVECVMHAERFDALVTFAGCDKSLPGMLMAAARLNLPSVFLYGGSILPGHYKDQALDIVSRVRGGRRVRGRARITENELGEIERRACPTEGSCAGMFTANTMASIARGDRHGAARLARRRPRSTAGATTSRTSRAARSCTCSSSTSGPRQIMTKEAFENAIAITMALGGSTNAVLHLLAIAHEARVELELDDFNRIGARVPHIADMKPHGKYHMTDLDRDRRRAGRDEEAARRRAAARRLPHASPARRWPRTSPTSTRPRPTATSCTRCRSPIHAQGGIADAARLARAEGRGGEGRRASTQMRFEGTRARVRRRGRARWPRSSPARSSPATSS